MTILVTGGAGFIGSNLVDRLLEKGHKIICLDNFYPFYDPEIKRKNIQKALGHELYELIEGDIRDRELIDACFEKNSIDLVVHLAAMAGVRQSIKDPAIFYDVNLDGTLILLESMNSHGVKKLVFASSSSVYGNNKEAPFREDQSTDSPISPYAASKKSGELLCSAYSHLYGFDIFCLRFFTVYGPRQRPEMAIHLFASKIQANTPIRVFGDGQSMRDYTFVDDIVKGVVAAVERVSGFEIINLGNSQTTKLLELINTLEEAIGKKAIMEKLPMQPGDVEKTYADVTKANKILGYQPDTSVSEGIGRFVKWLDSH